MEMDTNFSLISIIQNIFSMVIIIIKSNTCDYEILFFFLFEFFHSFLLLLLLLLFITIHTIWFDVYCDEKKSTVKLSWNHHHHCQQNSEANNNQQWIDWLKKKKKTFEKNSIYSKMFIQIYLFKMEQTNKISN